MNDLIELLQSLSKKEYTAKSFVVGASIGAHVRHIIEHYKIFIDGSLMGSIDYGSKDRDFNLQDIPEYAIATIGDVLAEIVHLNKCTTIVANGFPSTIGRELDYAEDHMIHHLALIKSILREMDLDSMVGPDFGLSKSTIEFRKNG